MNELLFVDRNNTNFPVNSKNVLDKIIKDKYNKNNFLKYYQFIIYQYLINNEKSRGILLYHGLGSGKSITAVSLSEFYRKHDPTRKIIILLAKTLQKNFKINIKKFMINQIKENKELSGNNYNENELDDIIDNNYKFISLNASNMYSQLTRIDKSQEEIIVEKQLKQFNEQIENKDFLENSLLIIDEYHNLSNSITNGSDNAIKLYDKILKTKNIKLLFLTGTPIINKPFELSPTFNMLNTYSPNSDLLFPELEIDFNRFFIDYDNNVIKNKNMFQNRIFGLTSYYSTSSNNKDFPTQLSTIVEKVPMSEEQFTKYRTYRDSEIEESAIGKKPNKSERFSSKSSITSSYRVKTRQVSNFFIPNTALTFKGKKIIKHISKLTKYEYTNLNTFSPKFKKIIENINKHKNQLGLFYSEFVSGEGVGIFSNVLQYAGYKYYKISSHNLNEYDLDILDKSDKQTINTNSFAVITGNVDINEREKIIEIFNSSENKTGNIINLLLISKTGAEGLDLKNVRHVHICEPYWNMARIEQIIARGVRYKSHIELPQKDHTVQPYIYLSDFPIKYDKKNIRDPSQKITTDVNLYNNANNAKKIINQFNNSLIESSVDCNFLNKNNNIKCKMCIPNNKQLFNNSLIKQMALPDPCEELVKETVKVNEILVNDDKFYYKLSESNNDSKIPKYHIFKYDKDLDGYVELHSHEEPYSLILKKLLKL